ncbi:MAG: hypothetical protein R2694_06675 [Ilumatobacteraceae bacterium]|nr:hypothetical protein [Ilumatobacteraceae bacterium]
MARMSWWEAISAAFVTEIRQPDGSRLLVPHTIVGCTDWIVPIVLPAPHVPSDDEPYADVH